MPGLKDFLFGTNAKTEKLGTKEGWQTDFMKNVIGSIDPAMLAELTNDPTFAAGSEWLRGILNGSPEAMQAMQQPFKNDFYQNVLPSIHAQFGGTNSLRSSDFMNALGGAAGNFENQLASNQWTAQNQAAQTAGQYGQIGGQNRQAAANLGQQSTFGYQQTPATTGFANYVGAGLAGGAGQGFGNYAAKKWLGQ